MDWGQFRGHWAKRHSYPGAFDKTHEKFLDDDEPIWYAIRRLHDKIHDGETDDFALPEDHIHLLPLAEQIKKDLEELI